MKPAPHVLTLTEAAALTDAGVMPASHFHSLFPPRPAKPVKRSALWRWLALPIGAPGQ